MAQQQMWWMWMEQMWMEQQQQQGTRRRKKDSKMGPCGDDQNAGYAEELRNSLLQDDIEYVVGQLMTKCTARRLALHPVGCYAVQEVFEKLKHKGDEETSVAIA